MSINFENTREKAHKYKERAKDSANSYIHAVGDVTKKEEDAEAHEVLMRTIINVAITVLDFIPIIGAVASWGADAAKIWAERKYLKDREKAMQRGEDPDKIQRSKLDLTPDVSTNIAVFSEVLEFISLDFLPTHGIETGLQISADWKKLKEIALRAKERRQEQRVKKEGITEEELEKTQWE